MAVTGYSGTVSKRSQLEGVAELTSKIRDLSNPKETAATLRASVREPMKRVMIKAKGNLTIISPGRITERAKKGTLTHKTYLGNTVNAGFAQESVRMITVLSKDKQQAKAILGVRKEAYYVLQFFELGSSKTPRQPWLQPAFRSSENAMLQGIADTMRKRMLRIAKQRAKGAGTGAGASGAATGRAGRVI